MNQTCRSLCETTRYKHIWVAVLISLCEKHDVPLVTFPLASMTAGEIERAALRPYRFEHRIMCSDDPHHTSSRTLTLALPLETSDVDRSVANRITDFCIVPGGRWIISTSRSGWLRCWDLIENRCNKPCVSYNRDWPIAGLSVQRSTSSASKLIVCIASVK